MQKPTFDPGLTQTYTGPYRRALNPDGTFNVVRRGSSWRDIHPYLYLVRMSWPMFFLSVIAAYSVVNLIFACVYYTLGPHEILGADAPTAGRRFLNMFFFSAHTLSTVGYGNISPEGLGANIIATLEALVGILGLAVATGLLFGRVSKPSAKIGFSEIMVVAPYQNGSSLQFRIVNRRSNSLMELDARVMLMTVHMENGGPKRQFDLLRLERNSVMFLPLTWTVVHPIEQDSPLWGKTAADLEKLQAEVLIVIKAYDDTFSQTLLARTSYTYDEIKWDHKFAPAFSVDPEGDIVLDLRKIGKMA